MVSELNVCVGWCVSVFVSNVSLLRRCLSVFILLWHDFICLCLYTKAHDPCVLAYCRYNDIEDFKV